MISGKEIKVIDINSEFYGVAPSTLMENAGSELAKFIIKKIKQKNKNILFFCGTGNNGGDGFVAARYLSKKYQVTVILTAQEKDIRTNISQKNFKLLKKTNTKIYFYNDIKKIDNFLEKNQIIVDSMLGIGIKGELRKPYSDIVKKINSYKNKTVFSTDIPTGFKTKNAIKPDYTITFHEIKNGMKKQNCGEIKKADIKVPDKAINYIGPGELKVYYPRPKKKSHKGDNGKVLVIGGGPFTGAPALSGIASLRTGADLVFISSPKKTANAIKSFSPLYIKPKRLAEKISKISPNLIVKELSDENNLVLNDFKKLKEDISKVNTVVIGPGLGTKNITQKTIKKIIKHCTQENISLVIDADAIQIIRNNYDIIKKTKTVITPHEGEFFKLTNEKLSKNEEKRIKTVTKWADKLGITILLKGHNDVISNGQYTKLNDIHNEAMTVGGTGDVLAGIIGALLSKNVEPFNAARIGAFINGYAGSLAYEKRSYGLIATDIIDEIPNVLKKYL